MFREWQHPQPGDIRNMQKFQSSMESTKIGWAWLFYKAACFMVLCITQPNLRLISEIHKELEQWWCSWGLTDRRIDNLLCHQWLQSWHHDDSIFSVFDLTFINHLWVLKVTDRWLLRHTQAASRSGDAHRGSQTLHNGSRGSGFINNLWLHK